MPQITPIRGFTNTPVTRTICILSTVVTLAVLIFSLKPYVKLAVDPFIVEYNQYWRVATFQLSPVNESDYMLLTILWFHFKTLERLFGARKYLLLIVLFALYNAVVTFLVLCLGQLFIVGFIALFKMIVLRQQFQVEYTDTVFNAVASGPFGLISLLYMCHGAYIPVSYHFKILLRKPKESEAGDTEQSESPESLGKSITLTNHFQIHVLYTILLLNHGFSTLVPCLIGLFIGHLYTQDLLAGSKNWVLPLLVFRGFVSPRKLHRSVTRSLRRRIHEYQPIEDSVEPTPVPEQSERPDEEDAEVALDDIRSNEENQEGRSATPVRPLGRQFLDTFRT